MDKYGIRTVKVEGDRLLLNGQPIQLTGFGKHEDFPINGRGLNVPLLADTDKKVAKSFKSSDGSQRAVLEGVDFRLEKGEIVALLGQSGSGKSTLLRIMAGLIAADGGDVNYQGQPIFAPVEGVAMVFQSFALFPWLTVQQNVELGLEARGVQLQSVDRGRIETVTRCQLHVAQIGFENRRRVTASRLHEDVSLGMSDTFVP